MYREQKECFPSFQKASKPQVQGLFVLYIVLEESTCSFSSIGRVAPLHGESWGFKSLREYRWFLGFPCKKSFLQQSYNGYYIWLPTRGRGFDYLLLLFPTKIILIDTQVVITILIISYCFSLQSSYICINLRWQSGVLGGISTYIYSRYRKQNMMKGSETNKKYKKNSI